MSQGNNRYDQCRRIRIGRKITDERLINLEPVHWQLFQVTERRVAGSEIIEGNLDSHAFQFAKYSGRGLEILHDKTLRQFEFEGVCLSSHLAQYSRKHTGQIFLLELP